MNKLFIFFLLVCSCHFVSAQYFTKVIDGPLVNTIGDSRSVNWIDVNKDGWIDCFISNGPTGGQNNFLYLNDKHGNFTAVLADPLTLDNKPSDGASFGDVDNDGDIDAFVVNWYNVNNLFYLNNGQGQFNQIDTGKLVTDAGYSETASWGDYDQDGLLDLYVTNSAGTYKNYMYHNNGSGFSKVATGLPVMDAYASRCVNWTDVDGDGDLDLFVTNENNQNENLYINAGGIFTSAANSDLVNNHGNTMSASWADYDNDGDMDVFLANDQGKNALFQNNGQLSFTKIINDTIVQTAARSFSAAWSDVDNDGDLDLFVTNSFGTAYKLLNYFYINNGDGSFNRNGTDVIAKDSAWSYGCAFGDYDNDGFQDLAVATCRFVSKDQPDFLYHNKGNNNHFLNFNLTGSISNRSAIGTKLRLKSNIKGNAVWQLREISAQTSYCGQNDLRAHFGLADALLADTLIIEWPSRKIEYYYNIPVDQFLNLTEGQATNTNHVQHESDFNIYPNPGMDSIILEAGTNGFHAKEKVVLTDAQGRVVAELQASNGRQLKINVKDLHLQAGTYSVCRINRNERACKQLQLH